MRRHLTLITSLRGVYKTKLPSPIFLDAALRRCRHLRERCAFITLFNRAALKTAPAARGYVICQYYGAVIVFVRGQFSLKSSPHGADTCRKGPDISSFRKFPSMTSLQMARVSLQRALPCRSRLWRLCIVCCFPTTRPRADECSIVDDTSGRGRSACLTTMLSRPSGRLLSFSRVDKAMLSLGQMPNERLPARSIARIACTSLPGQHTPQSQLASARAFLSLGGRRACGDIERLKFNIYVYAIAVWKVRSIGFRRVALMNMRRHAE